MAILELLSHVQEYINDDNHFTARWLKKGKTHFGLEADLESIAQVLAGVLAVLLFHGDQAQFITNSICILFPVMVTYIYPREGPPINLLLTYWATFSITSLLDNTFYTILPGYYLLKLFAMACMFLRPINGAQWIFIFLKKNNMSGFRLIRDESEVLKKILPPENPEDNERTIKLQMSFISVKSTSSEEKRSQMENSTSKSPSIDVDRTFPSGPISKQSKKEFDSVTKPLKETSDIFKSATSSGSIEDLSRTLSAYFNFPSENSGSYSSGKNSEKIDGPCKKKTFSPRYVPSSRLFNVPQKDEYSFQVASTNVRLLSEEEIRQNSEPEKL